MSDGLKNKAIVLTAVWLLLVASMSTYNLLSDFPSRLNLNELGDFVAETMSPFAIFWLVMVYLQQRKEMREQVAQTEKIAHETQKQVAIMDEQFKKQYEPFFVCHEFGTGVSIDSGQGVELEAKLTIENLGGISVYLRGKLHGEHNPSNLFNISVIERAQNSATAIVRNAIFVEKGQKVLISFYIPFNNDEEKHGTHPFELFYKDLLGREFMLEGQFFYESNMTMEGRWYEGTEEIKKTDVFPLPAKLIS